MLHSLRKRARTLCTAVAVGFVALWLGSFASACMAATGPACSTPESKCAKRELSLVATPCEQAAAPCELPSLDTPVSGKLHFPLAPFVTGPALSSFVAAPIRAVPPDHWQATRSTSTPLYLVYLALLN